MAFVVPKVTPVLPYPFSKAVFSSTSFKRCLHLVAYLTNVAVKSQPIVLQC